MRIAYLSLEFPPRIFGGLGVYVDEISREMVSLGERISVFTLGDSKLERHQEMNGVEVFRRYPVPIRDGLEIFLSTQTLSWGEGLHFLHGPFQPEPALCGKTHGEWAFRSLCGPRLARPPGRLWPLRGKAFP